MAKALFKGTPWYVHAAMIVSIILFIAGFLVPPMGTVDGSVLKGMGEIMGGAAVLNVVVNIPTYINRGVKAELSHGNTKISVSGKDSEE